MATKLKEYYATSDYAAAAFLCMLDYTLLGALDVGEYDQKGHPRYDFILTHTKLRSDPAAMLEDIDRKLQLYNRPFLVPGEDTESPTVSFKLYHMKLAVCKKAIFFPIAKDQLVNL